MVHALQKIITRGTAIAGGLLLLPYSAIAADVGYTPMVTLPGMSAGGTTLSAYAPALYKALVGIAIILAVIMLVIGGVKFIGSAGSEALRSEGKKDIWGAITGLIIIALSWIVLYAINPNLTTITLNFTTPPPAGAVAQGAPAGTVAGVTTGGGGTLGANGCTPSCTTLPGVPQKTPGAGCAAPGPCTVSPLIAGKLTGLNQSLQSANVDWTVSEMWPPTRPHLAACQRPGPEAGTCIDASLSQASRTGTGVNTFINSASSNGLRAVYEVTSEGRRQELISAGVPSQSVIFPKKADGTPWITGEHFSVYNS